MTGEHEGMAPTRQVASATRSPSPGIRRGDQGAPVRRHGGVTTPATTSASGTGALVRRVADGLERSTRADRADSTSTEVERGRIRRQPAETLRRDPTPPAASPAPAPTSGGPTTAPATAEPTIEVQPGKDLDVVKQAEKVPDWSKLAARLKERNLDSPDMVERCAEYVMAITAPTPQMAKVKYLLQLVNDRLSGAGAFDRRTGDTSSDDYSGKFNLWSGVKEQAANYGESTGGVALETSVAGSLFDGLNFGMKWNEALSHQWNELSRLYAEGIRGEVHIHQYRGVRTGSVFNKIEYPTIKDSIELGAVEPVVHLYANWGKFTKMNWGSPSYGEGEKSRKEEKVVKGKSALDSFMGAKWEFGDTLEKQGGYWPAGKGGNLITSPDGTQIKEGEEW